MTRTGFVLYSEFLSVPAQLILMKLILYAIIDDGDGWPINIPFAALGLLALWGINYLYTIGSAEVRHSAVNFDIRSKSCCKVDLYTASIRVVFLVFYLLKGSVQIFYLSVMVFVGEGFLAYNYYCLLYTSPSPRDS